MNNLAQEVPLAIVLNGINFSVILVTPFDLDDFIFGYLHSESVIAAKHDIHDIDIHVSNELPDYGALIAEVTLSNRSLSGLQKRQRTLKGASGCGLCGTESLVAAFPELTAINYPSNITLASLNGVKEQLREHQYRANSTGALHGAFWLSNTGDISICREDIGRHNALDKLLGHLLVQRISVKCGAVLVTSRCGIELVQKTVLIGVPTLISLASPTQFAVTFAKKYGLTLIHVPKQDEPYYLVQHAICESKL